MNSGLHRLLEGLNGDGGRPKTKILPEAAIARLQEALPRYTEPNPFKVGDLVTPRAGYSLNGVGEPHLVVEIFEPVRSILEIGSNGNEPLDMRVIRIDDHGNISGFYVEHANFDPWTLPAA